MKCNVRGRRSAEAQGCDCIATVVGRSPFEVKNYDLFINIFIFRSGTTAKSPALSFATQYAMLRSLR